MSRDNGCTGAVAGASAPLRISLAGGGTDLPDYSAAHGGEVLAFAIDAAVRVRLHTGGSPAPQWSDGSGALPGDPDLNALIAVLLDGQPRRGLHTSSRARSGAGLGSSGAFLVALAAVLHPQEEPAQLAAIAYDWEHRRAGRVVGPQDSYASAHGGAGTIRIARDGTVEVEPLELHPRSRAWIDDNFLLFDAGGRRSASAVAREVRRSSRAGVSRVERLHGIRALVPAFRAAMESGEVEAFGPLLTRNWTLKAGLGAAVATERAVTLLDICRTAGAHGGKLVGAGGGGYVLVSVPGAALEAVRAAMESVGASELSFRLSPRGVRTCAALPDDLEGELA